MNWRSWSLDLKACTNALWPYFNFRNNLPHNQIYKTLQLYLTANFQQGGQVYVEQNGGQMINNQRNINMGSKQGINLSATYRFSWNMVHFWASGHSMTFSSCYLQSLCKVLVVRFSSLKIAEITLFSLGALKSSYSQICDNDTHVTQYRICFGLFCR